MSVYYFGCRRMRPQEEAGHYLFTPRLTAQWDKLDWMYKHLGPIDQGFTPNLDKSQGSAHLEHVKGWTILSWHDYTGDSRPGSNSAVIVEGTHDFVCMQREFALHFPTLFHRQTAPLRITTEPANFRVR